MDFQGAKAAIFVGEKLLVYRRDKKDSISWADMWDFPGGGREGKEDSEETVLRETKEEFGLSLDRESIAWRKNYPSVKDNSKRSFFFVFLLPESVAEDIVFGDEGQYWTLMTTDEFLQSDESVPFLKTRLQDYLDQQTN